MTRGWVLVVAACSARPAKPIEPGSPADPGGGELARLSASLADPSEAVDAPTAPPTTEFGGGTYGNYVVPTWQVVPPHRRDDWRTDATATGRIDGVVRWRGALPTPLTTRCGTIAPARIDPRTRAVAGALVYIERITAGRPRAFDGRPATVGGIVAKRGCALLPAAQIVTPLPAAITLNGDTGTTNLRLLEPPRRLFDYVLQPGAHLDHPAATGVTRIEAQDGSLAAAFLVGLDTPAYAVTDDQGRFQLAQLADDRYRVTIWHPPIPTVVSGALVYDKPLVVERDSGVVRGKSTPLTVEVGR